jgi:hypothetical protein
MFEHIATIAHENGIHEIIVQKSSRQAVEEMFDYILQVHRDVAKTDTPQARFLIVIESDRDLPMNAISARTRKDRDQWVKDSRSATLTHNKNMANFAIRILDSMRLINGEARYFLHEERQKAIAWLLSPVKKSE